MARQRLARLRNVRTGSLGLSGRGEVWIGLNWQSRMVLVGRGSDWMGNVGNGSLGLSGSGETGQAVGWQSWDGLLCSGMIRFGRAVRDVIGVARQRTERRVWAVMERYGKASRGKHWRVK